MNIQSGSNPNFRGIGSIRSRDVKKAVDTRWQRVTTQILENTVKEAKDEFQKLTNNLKV